MKRKKLFTHIDAHIASEVVVPFVGTTIFLLFIFLMFQFLRLADLLINHRVPIFYLVKMCFFLVLSFSTFLLPVSFLTAVIVAYGKLSADSELVAMKSLGMSLTRFSRSVFAFAVVNVLLGIFLNLEWAPYGERQFTTMLYKISETKVASLLKAKVFNNDFMGMVLYADEIDNTGHMTNVFVYDEREPENPLTVVAQRGAVKTTGRERDDLSARLVLNLADGKIHSGDEEEEAYEVIDFDQYSLFLSIEERGISVDDKPRTFSFGELKSRIDKSAGRDRNVYLTEYWKRFAVSLSPLFFCFLGVGLGTVRTRSVQGRGFLVTLVTALTYWQLLIAAMGFAREGGTAAFIMQLPNLIMLIPALIVYKRASW